MDSTEWDERYMSADRLWSAGPNLYVEDRLRTVTPGVGLDLASGEGRNAVWLAARGWSMTAVDFSSVAVERGRRQSEAVRFVVADVRTWEPDAAFDLILVSYLHVVAAEMRSLLARAAGWLGPGGEMFLIGHDRSNIDDGYGGPQLPEILWDVDELVGMLLGLDIVEAEVVRRPVEAEGQVRIARDALVRARAALDQMEHA